MDEFPVVDAHHHFWDLDRNYHPWLCDRPPVPFRYGDYSAIRKNYLPPDYAGDSRGFNVVATVLMEGEWNPDDPLGESRWVQEIADQHGRPDAMVAQAWLDRDDVEEILAAQAAVPLVRGVRHKPRCSPTPDPAARGAMSEPAWRRGFALLRQYGLSFDLQAPFWHLYEARRLAEDFPETPIILDHTGLPADRSAEGLDAWRQALREIARAANVVLKISGIGLADKPWSYDDNRPVVLDALDIFGVERCLFASNFPVDKLTGSYQTIMGGYRRIIADCSRNEQLQLFHDNAVRIYRLDRPLLGE